jgi:hypothetical protein
MSAAKALAAEALGAASVAEVEAVLERHRVVRKRSD